MGLYDKMALTHRFGEIEAAKKLHHIFLGLGATLLILGILMVSFSAYATLFSVIIFGALLAAAGVVQVIQAFMARQWSGFFISLLLGGLALITGFLCLTRPEVAAISLTLWIAAFCFIAGIFRMATALVLRFDQWGWVFFNGLTTFILGMLIYADWPVSGLWVIGLFLGIDLIFSGWIWITLALSTKPSN